MKLLALKASPQNESRDRELLNAVLKAQWWVNPVINPSCGKVEPSPIVEGMQAYADGSNWNPGFGQGLYIYLSAAWVKL